MELPFSVPWWIKLDYAGFLPDDSCLFSTFIYAGKPHNCITSN